MSKDDKSVPDRSGPVAHLFQDEDLAGMHLLEIGCGDGANARELVDMGALVTAAEIDADRIENLAPLAGPNLSFQHCRAEDLPFPDGHFDGIVFFNSMHHVPAADLETALSEAFRVLKPGGRLFIQEPLAVGPGYEIARFIDDEEAAYARVQAALAGMVATGHFRPFAEARRYTLSDSYKSFQAYADMLVTVDPARRKILDAQRENLSEAFHRLAVSSAAGFTFPSDYTALILQRS